MNKKSFSKEWIRYLQIYEERPELFKDSGPIHIVLDEEIVAQYKRETGHKIGVLYESPYSLLLVDLVFEIPGNYFTYERIVPTVKNGAVVIVPIYNNKLILLKQYRHAIRGYEYSFPRGFGELNLCSEENAKKELSEEIGATVLCTEFLGEMTPDSGGQSTVVTIYSCEILSYNPERYEEGICEIIEISVDDLQAWISEGKIVDGFTLSAFCLYKMKK